MSHSEPGIPNDANLCDVKKTKMSLGLLNRDKYADAHEQQRIVKRRMEIIQEQLQETPMDEELIAKQKEYRENYMRILQLYLSIRTGGSNIESGVFGFCKIRVGRVSGSGKMLAGVFQFYGFQINPMGLKCLFSELFLFLSKSKN